MKMALCAGAIALATIGLLPVLPAQATEYGEEQGMQASINVERIKSVLKLTPEQARYWAPVEAAFRDLERHRAPVQSNDGFVHRMKQHAIQIVLTTADIQRLAVAARPLIAVLTDEQKQNAMGLAQEMGLRPVIASLN